MYCQKCGSVVNGAYCSNCGNPVSSMPIAQSDTQTNNGILVINRKNSFFGIAVNIGITIDGNPYQLSNNQQLSFALTPGVHTITYKSWCRRTKTVEINVVAGGNYLLDFVVDFLWGGFKLSKKSKLQ